MLIWYLQWWISPLEVLRIAWPFGDWPGTLDTSCLFEDKSCWTVSLEAQGQTVRTLFQKVKIIESFPQTSHLCPNSASANSVRHRYLTAPDSQSYSSALPRQSRGPATSSTTDARESGSTFCLARFQCHELEGVKGKGMEWGEEREQEEVLIFLTPTVRHKDVWALLRMRAARKRSILSRNLSFAYNAYITCIQLASGHVSMMSRRDRTHLIVYFCSYFSSM